MPCSLTQNNLQSTTYLSPGFPGGSEGKNPPANAADVGFTPGLEGSPGEGNGNPLQPSCLGNPEEMGRGAWQECRTRLSDNYMARRRPCPQGAEQTTGKHVNRGPPSGQGCEAGQIRRGTHFQHVCPLGQPMQHRTTTHMHLCF